MKRFTILITALFLAVIAVTGCAARPGSASDTDDRDYGGGLFDPARIHSIDIHMAEEDWQDLRENALEKKKYRAFVAVDGEGRKDVSCSAKGNSSLYQVKDLYGIDRYSLKLDFGKYEKEQRFHGLKKISLNNSFRDSTYMKDYLCYTMFRKAGVDAPLCSYAWVTVNDQDYGLFLVVEEVDENFLERNGWENSMLYKPDSDKLDADNPDISRIIQNGVQVEDYSEGAELGYRGERIEEYPDIFGNAETDAGEEDMMRVIRALKGVSEGKDPDQYLYTDELYRYFAVQNFVLNHDGYTGSLLHNYYLCEKDGRLAMFPWDYNAAFASRWAQINPAQSDATMLANYGIDTPLLGAVPEKRPMWKWIADNDTAREGYHHAMDEFLDYFESGEFETDTDRLREMLYPYVEKDPTAFCSAERFASASKALQAFILLRAQSVRRQLDGDLSKDTQEQSPEERVDASMMTIEDLS